MSREDAGGIKYYAPFNIARTVIPSGVDAFNDGLTAVEGELNNRILIYARLVYVTSGNPGQRLVTIQVKDKVGIIIFSAYARITQAKNRTVEYSIFSGGAKDSSGSAPDALDAVVEMAIPDSFIIQSGHSISILDSNAIDPLDTLEISGLLGVLVR